MDAADVDRSGTIDYNKFITTTVHMSKLGHEECRLTTFAYFDKDDLNRR
jgi:calcium-dependent protein kinase